MTFPDWHEPVSLLRRDTGPAASHQIDLVEQIGCQIDSAAPFGVVVARLEAFLGPRIRGAVNNPLPPTEAQMGYLTALSPSFTLNGESRAEISAWIDHYLSLATGDALKKLALKRGDAVRVRYQSDIDESPFY